MTSPWCETTLGKICDKVGGVIQTGPFGSQLHESDYSREGTPVVMPKDIIEGRIVTGSVARIAPEHVERLSRHKLKPGDIVYGRRGDIGRQALIRKEQDGWLCGTGCLRLSLSNTVIDPLFLHYYLRQESVIRWISNQAVGATLPNLNTGILRSVPVQVPSLPVQRRIAGILSAYDELIENNQRRIKILEEMARSLYREWFVHFRFPGHDKVKMVSSSLGPIPQGWEVKKLGGLTAILSRGISPTYDDEGGDSKVINQKCIRDQRLSLEPARRQSKPIPQDKHICFGDVLINSTGVGTLGRVAQVYENLDQCTVDTHVTIVRPKADTDVDFFGCTLLLKQENFERLGIGATGQTELSRTAIGEVETPVPPVSLQKRFGALIRPTRTAVITLTKQCENLRRTRDMLLPRLLSGHLEIQDADLQVGKGQH